MLCNLQVAFDLMFSVPSLIPMNNIVRDHDFSALKDKGTEGQRGYLPRTLWLVKNKVGTDL